MFSLKVRTRFAVFETLVELSAGEYVVTVGGVTSAVPFNCRSKKRSGPPFANW